MNIKFVKIGFGFILFLVVIGFIVITWVNGELDRSRGGTTNVVELKDKPKPYAKVIIKNVNILSPDCNQFIPNQNVVLQDGNILSIHQDSVIDEGYEIVDGQDKFLIPGLVDSHVHLRQSKNDLILYLANGVTYVREMSGNRNHLKWRDEIQEGALGPKMFIASEKVNSTGGVAGLFESWTRNRINYATEKAAAKKIRQLKDDGFDAVKISTFINDEMYRATVQEANKQALPIIGHIPFSVGLDSIYDAGQCEVAHVEEITKGMIRKFGRINADNAKEFLEYLEEQSDSIAIALRQNNIAVSTTVLLMESLPEQKFNLESYIKKVKLQYANPGPMEGTRLSSGWLPGNNSYAEPAETLNDPEKRRSSKIFWKTYVDAIHIMTRALAKNNVVIMAGTDANVPVTIPGFSLHDELVSLSKCGMTNAQVLYAATVAPGIWMKSNTGMIKEGYEADLVLLSKNPLAQIEHTTSIESVFCGRYWLTKNRTSQLLDAVAEANDKSRKIDISELIN